MKLIIELIEIIEKFDRYMEPSKNIGVASKML